MSTDIKWASTYDLAKVTEESVDSAVKAASPYMYGQLNLKIEMKSSSSGMYGKWYVRVSPSCTVMNVTVFDKCPIGIGDDLNDALKDFAEKMEVFCKEHL